MEKQQLVLSRFRESVNNKTSFIQSVADCLDISYDAAYRRVQGTARLHIDEAMKLAMAGQFSLDDVMVDKNSQTALGTMTSPVNSITALNNYLEETINNLQALGKTDVKLIYSAKDIPIYHHFDDTQLASFKIFVWMQLLDPTLPQSNFAYFQLPLDIKLKIKKIASIIANFKTIEIWNDTTVSSSLKQIRYFYESGTLKRETALALCVDLENCLKILENDLENGKLEIHYNELIIMTNNSMALKKELPVAGFVTMTMLGYIRFTAPQLLAEQYQDFKHQIKQSMSLNHSSSRDRQRFFNKMRQKINALQFYVERFESLDF